MKYYLKIYSIKPKEDVNRFVEGLGYHPMAPDLIWRSGIGHFVIKTLSLLFILFKLQKGDLLLIQYPYKKFYALSCKMAHLKGGKVITLIHDLGSFRRKKLTAEKENRLLMNTDYLICHNESMQKFIEENGFTKPIGTLDIFDYLATRQSSQPKEPHTPWMITFAGGLSFQRSSFLYQLDNHISNWELQLYGKGFNQEKAQNWKHVFFNGLFTPDELFKVLKGDFGLVWDGDSLDECSGTWGEYLRFNNPHKTSFTLRMGLPVIIWSKAAMAPFIRENRVGICIDSLRDLDTVLKKLTPEEYATMRENAEEMSRRIGSGYFTHRALLHAEKSLCYHGSKK